MSATIESIRQAAERLRQGGVVAFPTETVYGLGADAFNEAAVARVYELKGRPAHNPLIVHVSGPDMARRVVADWTPDADALARAFWPGPLSLILRRAPRLPAIVTAGGDGVAVRCPNHPVALALLFELDSPLVGPSANPSGEISPTTARHVRDAFGNRDLTVLDGGPCSGGIESTVLSLLVPTRPRILRPGLISPEEIEHVLGVPVEHSTGSTDHVGPLPSPGMLERHYAPHTPAHLFAPHEWPRVLGAHPAPAVVLTLTPRAPADGLSVLQMPSDAAEYAATLYAALREADAMNARVILIERPPTDGPVWNAVADRLRRATTPPTPPA